jgi:hypothetical protein
MKAYLLVQVIGDESLPSTNASQKLEKVSSADKDGRTWKELIVIAGVEGSHPPAMRAGERSGCRITSIPFNTITSKT